MKTIDTLTEYLNKIYDEFPNAAKRAVQDVADESVKIAEDNTPRSNRTLQQRRNSARGSNLINYTTPLAETIMQTGFRGIADARPYKIVAYDGDLGWYVHFVDTGTMYISPRYFISKTVAETEEVATRIFEETVREVYGI